MVTASIVACRLSKHFGGSPAVSDLSLEVKGGEVYGLIGPNGAGKTTALRMLVGLLRPSRGTASVCGFDVVEEPVLAKFHLGFLTSTAGLYARLTSVEVLTYFGELYGLTGNDLRSRIEGAARLLGMEHLLHRRCESLSTGERQRVSLARTILHDPPALILDEPTQGLDVVASRFVAEFIRATRARGRAILLCTHYLTEAELLCDRIGFLHRGCLLREGSPAALRSELGASSLEEAFLRLIDEVER